MTFFIDYWLLGSSAKRAGKLVTYFASKIVFRELMKEQRMSYRIKVRDNARFFRSSKKDCSNFCIAWLFE